MPSKSPNLAIASPVGSTTNLVGLVRRHPDVVVLVDDEPVGTIDAVDEHDRRAGASAAHRNPDDLIVACIRNKQSISSLVELETVGPEWRHSGRAQQGMRHPGCR